MNGFHLTPQIYKLPLIQAGVHVVVLRTAVPREGFVKFPHEHGNLRQINIGRDGEILLRVFEIRYGFLKGSVTVPFPFERQGKLIVVFRRLGQRIESVVNIGFAVSGVILCYRWNGGGNGGAGAVRLGLFRSASASFLSSVRGLYSIMELI